jgi:hypothetical protein
LIRAHLAANDVPGALNTFQEIKEAGIDLNARVFGTLISAVAAYDLSTAERLWKSMLDHNYTPLGATFIVMINAYVDALRPDDAFEMIKQVPATRNQLCPRYYASLLQFCEENQKQDLLVDCLRHMFTNNVYIHPSMYLKYKALINT